MKHCVICDNTGWVCEGHGNHPWAGVSNRPDSCDHGPGVPCPGVDCENSMDWFGGKAEIEKLREALRDCLGWHDYSNDMHKPIEVRAAYMRARAALEQGVKPNNMEEKQ